MASFEIGAANGVSSSSNAGKSSGVQKQTPEYKIGENLNGQSQRPKTELPKTSDGDLDGKAIALKLNSLNNRAKYEFRCKDGVIYRLFRR